MPSWSVSRGTCPKFVRCGKKVQVMLRPGLQVPCTRLTCAKDAASFVKGHRLAKYQQNPSASMRPRWNSGSFATKVHACHFMCAAMKNKSAAKRKEHRQGRLQKNRTLPTGLPPQHCTWWPRVLSNRKLYFENGALFSQRLAPSRNASAPTHPATREISS